MEITLVDITDDAVEKIGYYAGECYAAKRDKGACVRRAAKCMQDGHLATLRFAHATFHISGISRACSHQLVRSKFLDFLQQSQRYVNQNDVGFIIPDSLKATPQMEEQTKFLYEDLLNAYNNLIKRGVKKEDARFVLPEATQTSMFVVGNFQAWKDFIKLRANKHAQWEIRELAKAINNELNKHCPELFMWMP